MGHRWSHIKFFSGGVALGLDEVLLATLGDWLEAKLAEIDREVSLLVRGRKVSGRIESLPFVKHRYVKSPKTSKETIK